MKKKVQVAAEYLFAKHDDVETLYNVGDDLFLDNPKSIMYAEAALAQLNFIEFRSIKQHNLIKMIKIMRTNMPKQVVAKTKK